MTSHLLTEDKLRADVAALVSVRPSRDGYLVELPVLYPTGDLVAIEVMPEGSGFLVTDSGHATMALLSHGANLTTTLEKRLASLAAHYGCEYQSGRMFKRVEADEVAITTSIVANASRSIADQILSLPAMPIIDFRIEALEAIRSAVGERRVQENASLAGESGSRYGATAIILSLDGERQIGVVEPVRDHEAATKRFREFWDISRNVALQGLARIAMYDDRRNWQAADLSLLEHVANVVRLSDIRRRLELLTT